MTEIQIGSSAPQFEMPDDRGDIITLSSYEGKYLILFFYPKDNTPGCTTESKDFSALKEKFSELGAHILGVSRDSVKKHQNFIAKQDLSIQLGADLTGEMTEAYGVWVEKKMYGKTYMGIQRATFLIGPGGDVINIWPKVKVKGHAEEVLQTLKNHLTE